jgi:hypothetical protein
MEIYEGDTVVCRDCGNKTATIVGVDDIPCVCGEITKVYYISCTCGYSYRLAGDIFLDGDKLDLDQVGQVLEKINEFFEDVDIFSTEEPKPMGSLIHKCLKCGELAVETDPNKYECTICGFSWEVDDAK